MNTIDCSPIGRDQVSSLFCMKRFDDIEELIPCGAQDSQKSPWPQPGSFLGRVEPHVHEFARTWPEKPDLEQGRRAVRGHGRASAHTADAGLWRRQQGGERSHRARAARAGRHPGPEGQVGEKRALPSGSARVTATSRCAPRAALHAHRH
ncbi:hypothetical protein FERRO_14420 [Ferrovum sp. JA12]|nr:hypothetical protein FERRO_14420 [Ferrovum sp. JA12]